jgi:hypothetical protein
MKRRIAMFARSLAFSFLAAGASASGAQLELSAGSEYSSLKLAHGGTSTIWYAPISARLDIGNWTFRATVPYLSITAPESLIVLLDDDPTGAGVGNVRPGSESSSLNARTVNGIGDSTLSAVYSFDEIAKSRWYVDLGARVRLPTGNENEGTGIGATDYGLQSEVGYDLDRWGAAISAGRRYLGAVAGLGRVDGWQAGSDVWLHLGHGAVIGAYYDWRDASERGLSNPTDAGFYFSYRLSPRWKLRLDTSRALDLPAVSYTVALTAYWRLSEERRNR